MGKASEMVDLVVNLPLTQGTIAADRNRASANATERHCDGAERVALINFSRTRIGMD
jgi:hypothetical protein